MAFNDNDDHAIYVERNHCPRHNRVVVEQRVITHGLAPDARVYVRWACGCRMEHSGPIWHPTDRVEPVLPPEDAGEPLPPTRAEFVSLRARVADLERKMYRMDERVLALDDDVTKTTDLCAEVALRESATRRALVEALDAAIGWLDSAPFRLQPPSLVAARAFRDRLQVGE